MTLGTVFQSPSSSIRTALSLAYILRGMFAYLEVGQSLLHGLDLRNVTNQGAVNTMKDRVRYTDTRLKHKRLGSSTTAWCA
eukprot:scaffold317410_cov40-Prasinocladus_malaysianus.AAC.1